MGLTLSGPSTAAIAAAIEASHVDTALTGAATLNGERIATVPDGSTLTDLPLTGVWIAHHGGGGFHASTDRKHPRCCGP